MMKAEQKKTPIKDRFRGNLLREDWQSSHLRTSSLLTAAVLTVQVRAVV